MSQIKVVGGRGNGVNGVEVGRVRSRWVISGQVATAKHDMHSRNAGLLDLGVEPQCYAYQVTRRPSAKQGSALSDAMLIYMASGWSNLV